MSAVLAAALLAKAVFVLLLLLSCVLGQEDGVCFGRERDLALGCVRRKEVSTRAKQVRKKTFKTFFSAREGRLGVSGESGWKNSGLLVFRLASSLFYPFYLDIFGL